MVKEARREQMFSGLQKRGNYVSFELGRSKKPVSRKLYKGKPMGSERTREYFIHNGKRYYV